MSTGLIVRLYERSRSGIKKAGGKRNKCKFLFFIEVKIQITRPRIP